MYMYFSPTNYVYIILFICIYCLKTSYILSLNFMILTIPELSCICERA